MKAQVLLRRLFEVFEVFVIISKIKSDTPLVKFLLVSCVTEDSLKIGNEGEDCWNEQQRPAWKLRLENCTAGTNYKYHIPILVASHPDYFSPCPDRVSLCRGERQACAEERQAYYVRTLGLRPCLSSQELARSCFSKIAFLISLPLGECGETVDPVTHAEAARWEGPAAGLFSSSSPSLVHFPLHAAKHTNIPLPHTAFHHHTNTIWKQKPLNIRLPTHPRKKDYDLINT